MKRIIEWLWRIAAPGRRKKPLYRLTHIRYLKPGDRCWTPVLGSFVAASEAEYERSRDSWIVFVVSPRDLKRPLNKDDLIYRMVGYV